MKKKKGRGTTALLVIVFFAGLVLVLYPTVANYWNSMHQSKAIAHYSEVLADVSNEDYEKYLEEVRDYNRRIQDRDNVYVLSDEERAEYEDLLNVADNGVMGYIEIPFIEVVLPIYHGTSDAVLQIAVGHLDWTSLPLGGVSTHCVLSGHRGLPSAKLFTDLDKLMVGDVFMIRVLNEVVTYEVDQILIVEPSNIEPLQIVDGKDYCTLITCTPYGINTHRLLVRGRRIENAAQAVLVNVTAEAVQIEPLLVCAVMAVPALILILLISVFSRKKTVSNIRKELYSTQPPQKT